MSGHDDNRLRSLQALRPPLAGAWQAVVDGWLASADGQHIRHFIAERLAAGATVYPARPLRMLELTPLEAAHVVIVGQDPYHGPGQAQGLAFSVSGGTRLPPSLRNIFKERSRDLGLAMPSSGDLTPWARHGVLLMNTTLTVEQGAAASHAGRGWESLAGRLIDAAARDARPKVFMLWGAHAQRFAAGIAGAGRDHLVLQANHPSPLSATRGPAPFVGCGHFGRAAEFLEKHGVAQDWSL